MEVTDTRVAELLELIRSMDAGDPTASLSEDPVDEAIERLKRIREQGEPRLTELLKVLKQYAKLNFNVQAPYSQKGDEVDALAVGINMMGKRLQESSISRQYFDDILRNLIGMVFVVDMNGIISLVNEEVVRKLGYSEEKILGMHLSDVINEMEGKWLFNDGTPREIPARCITAQGDSIPIIFTASALPVNKANTPSFVCLAYDVSRSKEAERKLIESEYLYRNILETMDEGVLMVDTSRKIFFVNQRFCDMTGYTEKELIGTSPKEKLISEKNDHDFLEEMFHKRMNKESDHYELLVNTKDGRELWILINASPIFNIHGEVIGSLGAHTDITDRKMADMQIQSQLEEKELLIKEIHHRVKNNLQVISSLLSLQANYAEDAGTRHILRESQNRIKSMAAIHEKLYQSSNLASIDFADYTHQIITQLQYSFGIPEGKIELRTDVHKLYMGVDTAVPCGLLINELLSNAFKYAFPEQKKGVVEVVFKEIEGGKYYLKVSDNGVGIPEDVNLDNTTSLGLQLVATLTEQLEGTIALDRTNGSCFEISFEPSMK